jgi:hypothetical protein
VPPAPLFGPLPRRGVWNAVGLERGQFLAILALSVVLFLFVDGPLWRHLHDNHFSRIVVSYGAIPPLVALALHRNRAATLLRIVEASALLALVKLVVTAVLLLAVAAGR